MLGLVGADQAIARAALAQPVTASLLLAAIALAFHHTAAGMQVIIEDYANQEWVKVGSILAIKAICWLLALASALAVLRIAV